MPNDTLDEIEARWAWPERWCSSKGTSCQRREAQANIRTLIEMVRARDVDIEQLHQTIDCLEWLKEKHDAALDTPPAQEQKR